MTGLLLLGALFGAGLTCVLAWAVPARPSLAQTFAALHPSVNPPPAAPLIAAPPASGWVARFGRPAVPVLAGWGLPRTPALADLAICGRDPARHLAEQGATAVLAFLAIPAFTGVLALAGVGTGWELPLWASIVGAVIGLFLPDLALASEARKRRTELRDAVAGMLDLVVIALAGGAGVEQALREASEDPTGWAQSTLRRAVEAAHLTRRPPWQTLGDLGESTGVSALSELAAALSLAGSEGARVKATLSARSAALSAHQLADAEAAAVSATEAMVLPVVLLFGAFLLFIGYPAFATVLHAL